MKHCWFLPGIVLVVVVTVLSGILQGRMRNRWGPSADILATANRLAEIPSRFGDSAFVVPVVGSNAQTHNSCRDFLQDILPATGTFIIKPAVS